MLKSEVVELINKATKNVTVPAVAKQKAEFYKAGVRELLAQIQNEIDLLEK
tara:strand:- start:2998 stop:3150 length:153 start_codon:yes stop_codon:yes gene_type:complete